MILMALDYTPLPGLAMADAHVKTPCLPTVLTPMATNTM